MHLRLFDGDRNANAYMMYDRKNIFIVMLYAVLLKMHSLKFFLLLVLSPLTRISRPLTTVNERMALSMQESCLKELLLVAAETFVGRFYYLLNIGKV